jgi:hypothetical protein
MTLTAREVIRLALQAIGAVASTAPMTAAESADGLISLQGLLNTLATHRLTLARVAREVYTLTLGTGSYVIGAAQVAPNWLRTGRPLYIEWATVVDTAGREYPLNLLTDAQYQAIEDKTLAGWPSSLYHDHNYPTATITLWPKPTATQLASAALYVPVGVAEPTTLDTSLVLPEGAYEALVYGLALRLAPTYGKPADGTIVSLAQEGLGSWKRSNLREHLLELDAGLTLGSGAFDWRTGE